MLWSGWCTVLELQQGLFDTVFHACFECSVVAVPLEVNANTLRASPVSFDGMMVLEGSNQVFCILLALAADSKVVHHWGERDGPCLLWKNSPGVCFEGWHPHFARLSLS